MTTPKRDCIDDTTVCICTYQRPAGIRRTLESLADMSEASLAALAEVVVIDNDASRTAESTVEELAKSIGYKLSYYCEPTPGISAARNRAMSEASSRFVAFIDDDETVDPEWLAVLRNAQVRTSGAAIVGSVTPSFEELQPPEWMIESGILDFPNWERDTQIDTIMSGNLLLDTAAHGLPSPMFDPEFGLTGGSDHLLGRTMARSGLVVTFEPEAKTFEWIPSERLQWPELMRRARRSGNTESKTALHLAEGKGEFLRVYVTQTAHCIKLLALPVGRALRALSIGRSKAAVLEYRGNIALGRLQGVIGTDVVGYARSSDSSNKA